MKMNVIGMTFQETGRDAGPPTNLSPGRATRVEAAREGVCTAALRGCPVDIEAAARAYCTEANRALLANLWGLVPLKLSTAWRRVRGRDASPFGPERAP